MRRHGRKLSDAEAAVWRADCRKRRERFEAERERKRMERLVALGYNPEWSPTEVLTRLRQLFPEGVRWLATFLKLADLKPANLRGRHRLKFARMILEQHWPDPAASARRFRTEGSR